MGNHDPQPKRRSREWFGGHVGTVVLHVSEVPRENH